MDLKIKEKLALVTGASRGIGAGIASSLILEKANVIGISRSASDITQKGYIHIQKDLSILTDRLSKINESLSRKNQARNEYDKTIQETEAAYMKILESSQTLLHVLKRESVNLTKKQSSSQ